MLVFWLLFGFGPGVGGGPPLHSRTYSFEVSDVSKERAPPRKPTRKDSPSPTDRSALIQNTFPKSILRFLV